jgi:hypothetical protein
VNVSSSITDASVWIAQRERVRALRVQRHLVVALLAGLGCVFVADSYDTLLGLTLISILVYVVLDSLGRAMDAYRGFMWGWVYPEPKKTTLSDRVVDSIVQRLAAAPIHRQGVGQVDDLPPRVRRL